MTGCYHCGLPTSQQPITAEISGKNQLFCCYGCLAVTQTLWNMGFAHYYDVRELPTGVAAFDMNTETWQIYDDPIFQKSFLVTPSDAEPADKLSIYLTLDGMTCAACVWLLESVVKKLPGILLFSINASTRRAQVVWDRNKVLLSQILSEIARVGYRAFPHTGWQQECQQQQERRDLLMRLGVAGFGSAHIMMFAFALYMGEAQSMAALYWWFFRYLSLIVSVPIILYSAMPFYQGAWRSLKNRYLTMDVSVSLAIVLLFVVSTYATLFGLGSIYFDSITMLIFLLSLGRYVEMRARHRATWQAYALIGTAPELVQRVDEGDQHLHWIPVSQLKIKDCIWIAPGKNIPADGVVIEGETQVSEALLTGEFSPKIKNKNDSVFAGSLNILQPIRIQITQVGSQTLLGHLLKLYEKALAQKPKWLALADQYAHYFVFAVMLIAVLTGVVWYWIAPARALIAVIAVLVVTCPCAFSLAAPTAVTAAITALAEKGFLCTQSHVIETLAEVVHLVFDKTGTLTAGALSVVHFEKYRHLPDAEIFSYAATLEASSTHPIAKAFSQYPLLHQAEKIKFEMHQGLQGMIDKKNYRIGQWHFVHANHTSIMPDLPAIAVNTTPIYLADDEGLIAAFYLQDHLRIELLPSIKAWQKAGYHCHILSGDHSQVVADVAHQLQIPQFMARATPKQKQDYVKKLQENGEKVLMVGDGLNDIPVLGQADVSVAVAQAADLTRIQADALLLNSDLTLLQPVLLFAKKTRSIIRQNLQWALFYNVLVLPLAMLGYVQPYVSAIGMSFSSMVVVGNAMRLLNRRAP